MKNCQYFFPVTFLEHHILIRFIKRSIVKFLNYHLIFVDFLNFALPTKELVSMKLITVNLFAK